MLLALRQAFVFAPGGRFQVKNHLVALDIVARR
jgi:hypothetical protein